MQIFEYIQIVTFALCSCALLPWVLPAAEPTGGKCGGHADEIETSVMLAHRPELVHLDRAKEQSDEDLKRLEDVKG